MFELVVIIACVITLILLKIFLNVNFKSIRSLKDRDLEELQELSKKIPSEQKICEEILNKLGNKGVKVKIEPEYTNCLYTIFNNTIIIGKFQQNYMKLQTIAHECIHSCQNKTTLWANFIFTNIYLIYFWIILILEILNKLQYANIHILIFVFLSLIQYIIRSTLENDAMIKAKYVAQEYLEDNKILNELEKEKLLKEYDEINNIGISFTNYSLIATNIIKIILFTLIVLV